MRAARRLVLTRERHDNVRLLEALGGCDVEVVHYPCIRIERLPLAPEIAERMVAGEYAGAVFPSRNAVVHLLGQVEHPPVPRRVVAIGLGTAEVLEERGWHVTGLPSEARAEVAAFELAELIPEPGRVLVARGTEGSHLMTGALRMLGREVDEALVYRNSDPVEAPLPGDERPTLVVFASPTAARNFHAHNPDARRAPDFEALAIGLTTARTLRQLGYPFRTAESSTIRALAKAVRAWCR